MKPITYRNRLGMSMALIEVPPPPPVPGPQADIAHHHVAMMGDHQHRLDHHHVVDLENPAHIHRMCKTSSGARFDENHIRGARKQAGLE